MRIEYLVTFGKHGPKLTHRVTRGGCTGSSDGGGSAGGEGPDDGGSAGGEGPDDGSGTGCCCCGNRNDGGGSAGGEGPDDGGSAGGEGPDDGGGTGFGCGTIIVAGPTVITGGCGCGGCCSGSSARLPAKRPLPKTEVVKSIAGRDSLAALIANNQNTLLNTNFFYQEQTNWCWAAVGAGVRDLSNVTPKLRQCEIATQVVGQDRQNFNRQPLPPACGNPGPSNLKESLRTTLDLLNHLQDYRRGGIADFALIQQEIGQGRPVAARIAWDPYDTGFEHGAHFVLIVGWKIAPSGAPTLVILDPSGGTGSAGLPASPQDYGYDEFQTSYKGSGKWVASYFVK